MEYKDDVTFIEALKRGEERAYIFLVDSYYRRLHGYALSLIGDHIMAEDIVQNVFIKTWRFRKKLNSTYSIKSFLFKSVYNEFLNTYQKNKSTMLLQYKYIESLHEVAESTDEATIELMIKMVNNEILNLPPKCQRVFTLSKKEGLTNSEISEFLNVPLKTVESQITKSYTLIRKKLKEKFGRVLLFMATYIKE